MNLQEWNALLLEAHEKRATDVHLLSGAAPAVRIDGQIFRLEKKESEASVHELVHALLSEKEKLLFMRQKHLDRSYEFTAGKQNLRCRLHIFHDLNGWALAVRLLPARIPNFRELHLPERKILPLLKKKRGLILVAGPTGQGKTTTLAAMLDYINQNERLHIVTIEQPVEYVHTHRQSIISQREVGKDARSFESALEAVLREDPDILLVGEMRSRKTMETALYAAETGHLVFSTLHTASAIESIDRIAQYFPGAQQQEILQQIANSIEGIFVQKLLPEKSGKGRIPAMEIVVRTPAIVHLIRNNRLHEIKNYMHGPSMQTMEDSIQDLKLRGIL